VRQLFEDQSGFFLRFAATVHAPVAKNPSEFGIQLLPLPDSPHAQFAKNDIGFIDPVGTDHDTLGLALKKAIYNYMHGLGTDNDVRQWFKEFGVKAPKPTVSRHFVEQALRDV
jgi:hypothetical protein